MKIGCIAADYLHRGMVTGPVWLAPFKSIKHMGYENTTRGMEISTQKLHTKCLVSAKGKSSKYHLCCKIGEFL